MESEVERKSVAIRNEELEENDESDEIKCQQSIMIHQNGADKENNSPNDQATTKTIINTSRRTDEPSVLKFEICESSENLLLLIIDEIIQYIFVLRTVPENQEERAKRRLIEAALKDPSTSLEQWRTFAKSEYGLINGMCSRLYVLQ